MAISLTEIAKILTETAIILTKNPKLLTERLHTKQKNPPSTNGGAIKILNHELMLHASLTQPLLFGYSIEQLQLRWRFL